MTDSANLSAGDHPQETTKEKILDAANRLVGAKGFHATSIRDIAQESGINPALVYYHFGSKEGLFLALAQRNSNEVGDLLLQTSQGPGNAEDRVRAFGLAWLGFAFERKKSFAPWFRHAIQEPGPIGDTLRSRVAANIGVLARILEADIETGVLREPKGGARFAATAIMWTIAGIAMELPLPHDLVGVDLSSKGKRAEHLEGVIDLFFQGLIV